MTYKEREQQYKQTQEQWKQRIKNKPTKFKRFIGWCWYLIVFPWFWVWQNIHDWRTFIIFILVMAVVGSEVWVPLLLGLIFHNNWLLGIAAACEIFWLGPGTPFLLLCIAITAGIKSLINRRH